MTQQDDITQRVLTAEHHLNELMRLTQPWPNATIPCATVRSHVEQALSQVRAPVADERAQDVDLPWLRAYMHHQIASDRWVVTADQARDFARAAVLADRQARAALASAPVADLRPHLEWALRRIRTSLDTGDKYEAAQAALDAAKAAPVASAPVAEPYDSEKRCRAYYDSDLRPFAADGLTYNVWQAVWHAAQFDRAMTPDSSKPRQHSAPVAGEQIIAWDVQDTGLGRRYTTYNPKIAEDLMNLGENVRPLVYASALPPANAAPQASAENVRNAALEEAAQELDRLHAENRRWHNEFREGAAVVRALSATQAGQGERDA